MKIGICSIWGDRLDDFQAKIQLSSNQSFDLVSQTISKLIMALSGHADPLVTLGGLAAAREAMWE